MNHRSILPAFALGLLIASAAAAQHHHVINTKTDYDDPTGGDPNPPAGCSGVQARVTITSNSSSFSPAVITVDPGEAVCWSWSGTALPHNLKADDGSFTSGPPSDRGTFQRTFTTPGTYGYFCEVHGSRTAGMRGTVVVRGGGGGSGGGGEGSGKLELSPSYTVSEGAGTLTVTVERTGGSDGAASVKIATAPGTAKPGKDFTTKNGTLSWANGDQAPKTFQVPLKNDTAPEPNETFAVKLSKATGAAMGTSTATVTIQDDDGGGCAASLTAPAHLRAQGQSPGEIRLTWADESSAAISFRIERREPGGTFQEIASLPAGVTRYTDAGLPGGSTFQYRVRAEGIDGVSPFSAIAAGATDGSTAACDETRALCLHGGRFEATLQGPGREAKRLTLPGTVRSGGLFAISAEGAPQLLLNVSNGCAVNGHFGVDLAAISDAEFTVKVRDTRTGRTWVYFNPEGSAPAPVRDADAFSTCQ
jgi:plastocyanin